MAKISGLDLSEKERKMLINWFELSEDAFLLSSQDTELAVKIIKSLNSASDRLKRKVPNG
jgi:hypothetical protein